MHREKKMSYLKISNLNKGIIIFICFFLFIYLVFNFFLAVDSSEKR